MANTKEENKTRLYINIGLLFVIFIVSVFYFYPMFFGKEELAQQEVSTNFVRKYNNLKKLDGGIFNDERFKTLKNPVVLDYPKPKIGNPEPFAPK